MTTTITDEVQNSLNALYEEGDIDWISFGQILSAVTYGTGGREFGKSDSQKLHDALRLVEFLNATGDFEVGELFRSVKGEISFAACPAGIREFVRRIEELTARNGIHDPDVILQFWLNKKRPGCTAPMVNETITRIFGF